MDGRCAYSCRSPEPSRHPDGSREGSRGERASSPRTHDADGEVPQQEGATPQLCEPGSLPD